MTRQSVASLAVAALVLAACSSGSSGTGGGSGGGGGTGGGSGIDYEWTRWPVPADAPPASTHQASGGIVTDTVTGLQWQQTASGTGTWGNANTYCAGLSLGGASWRLPALVELKSIVDYGSTTVPAIDAVAFLGTPPIADFWSSSPVAQVALAGNAWVVSFDFGGTGPRDPTANNWVRCVRCAGTPCEVPSPGAPGAPPGRYTASTDTVLDTATTLTWQRRAPVATYTWANAATYCSSLNLEGMTGWRLPTVKELQSLVDIRGYNPAIDAVAFPSTPIVYFWSSSPFASVTSDAWAVDFRLGFTERISIMGSSQVRCVR